MGSRDPRVDAYIAKSAAFAQPILVHLREIVHRAVPKIEETIKWGMPTFELGGIVCHMAAFKAHCAFGLWNGDAATQGAKPEEAMGHYGRITRLADLPSDRTLAAAVRKAAALRRAGARRPARLRHPRKPLRIPADLAAALAESDAARKTFDAFPPSHRREYVEWITEAKTGATRAKRLATTLEWLAEGKPRNWKYMKPTAQRTTAKPPQK